MNSTPISPSLFIFSAQVLRTGLTNLFQNGKFQAFSMAIGGPSISHLAFAEDMGGVTLAFSVSFYLSAKEDFPFFHDIELPPRIRFGQTLPQLRRTLGGIATAKEEERDC